MQKNQAPRLTFSFQHSGSVVERRRKLWGVFCLFFVLFSDVFKNTNSLDVVWCLARRGRYARLPGQDTTVSATLLRCSFSMGTNAEWLIPAVERPFTAMIMSPHLGVKQNAHTHTVIITLVMQLRLLRLLTLLWLTALIMINTFVLYSVSKNNKSHKSHFVTGLNENSIECNF